MSNIYKKLSVGNLMAMAVTLPMVANTTNTASSPLLPHAAELFPYMQAVRFLWDYLNGDHYWKCKYPEHNLVRAQNQWHLFLKAKEHEEEMKEVINNL